MTLPVEDRLIASLTEDLRPVRPVRRAAGGALALAALVATVFVVAVLEGLGSGILQGRVSAIFLVTNGLLLVVGSASAAAVVAMANPAVGSRHDGPKWAMAALAVLPLAAIVTGLLNGAGPAVFIGYAIDWHCLATGLLCSVGMALALGFWLRRGAPVSAARAGPLLGVASGASGAFAYGMACPLQTMNHLGIWHVAPVAIAGLLGWMTVPRLLRW